MSLGQVNISSEWKDLLRDKQQLESVSWLWHSDYYDGRLSGMIEYGFEERRIGWAKNVYYGDLVCFIDCGQDIDKCDELNHIEWTPRVYAVYALFDEQYDFEAHKHREFEKYVGLHCSYDKDGKPKASSCKTSATHHLFYDKYREAAGLDLSKNEIVGWIWR